MKIIPILIVFFSVAGYFALSEITPVAGIIPLDVKVFTTCDLQALKSITIENDLKTFKGKNSDNSLRELTSEDKASLKSCEIAKRGTEFAGIYNSIEYGVRIEIIGDVKAIDVNGQHGVEVFAKAWRGTQQLGFGKDGSVEIERFRIFNPPVLVDDPNGTIIRPYKDAVTGEPRERKYREDSIEAIKQVIFHNVKLVGKDNTKIVAGKVGNTTSTFYPASGTSGAYDGWYGRHGVNETWSTIKGGAATEGDATTDDHQAFVQSSGTSNQWARLNRAVDRFDTSAISDTDTIDSATLSLRGIIGAGTAITVTANIYSITVSSTYTQSEYTDSNFGTTAFSTGIVDTSWSTGAFNDFVLNASGISNISKTGISSFAFALQEDRNNSAPSWSASASGDCRAQQVDFTGTANDPKLVVVHSEAVAAVDDTSFELTE